MPRSRSREQPLVTNILMFKYIVASHYKLHYYQANAIIINYVEKIIIILTLKG